MRTITTAANSIQLVVIYVREIDERLRKLEESRRKLRDVLEVRANSLTLPRGGRTWNGSCAIETANERQLNGTLDRLERLQQLRKGDYVPTPLRVPLEGPLNGNSEN